jgi:hypothetical protein
MSALNFWLDSNGKAIEAVSQSVDPWQVPLCSGMSQYHTDNPDNERARPLDWITLQQVREMIESGRDGLKTYQKDLGPWFVPSDIQSRSHAEHHSRGQFWALWFDADDMQFQALEDSTEAACRIIPGTVMAYTSRSATRENPKHRLIIPLSEPLSGARWLIYQRLLNEKMQAAGIAPDDVNERCGQPCFLPNPGELFETYIRDGGLMDPQEWAQEADQIEQAELEAEQQRQAKLQAARQHRLSNPPPEGGIMPSEWIREHYSARTLLESLGATFVTNKRFYGIGRTIDGKPGGYYDPDTDRFYSHHAGDEFADGYWHGAVDLLMKQHGIDWQSPDALVELCRVVKLDNGKTIEEHNRQVFMQAEEREQAAREFEHLQDTPEPSQSDDVDPLTPPGIAGDICQLMGMKANRDLPEVYPLAALHVLAMLSHGRGSVYTDKLNLITLAIAPSGSGKENPQNVAKDLLRAAWMSGHVVSDMASHRDMIYSMVEGDGLILYIIDEIHSILQAMKGKNAASYESKMEAEILKMTTTGLYTFRGMEKRTLVKNLKDDLKGVEKQVEDLSDEDALTDKGLMLIRTRDKLERQIDYLEHGWPNPFCSIMGHSVPERLDKFASDADSIASGFIGRSLVVRCSEQVGPLKQKETKAAAHLEHELSERLKRVKGQKGQILATPEADEFLRGRIAFYDADEQRNCQYLGAIYRRTPEQLLKVASVLAAETGTITIEHARYADALVNASVKDVRYLIIQKIAQGEAAADGAVIEHARLKILKQCKGQGMAPSRLQETVTRSKEWDAMQKRDVTRDRLQELLTGMIEREELELVQEGRRSRYRSKAVI